MKTKEMVFSWVLDENYLVFPGIKTGFVQASLQTISALFISWRCFARAFGRHQRQALRRTQVMVTVDGKDYRIKKAYYSRDDLSFHIEVDTESGPLTEPDFNLYWKKVDGEKIEWEVPITEEDFDINRL